MGDIEYKFREINIQDMGNFEKELRIILDDQAAGDWVLSALFPKGSGPTLVAIFHRQKMS